MKVEGIKNAPRRSVCELVVDIIPYFRPCITVSKFGNIKRQHIDKGGEGAFNAMNFFSVFNDHRIIKDIEFSKRYIRLYDPNIRRDEISSY